MKVWFVDSFTNKFFSGGQAAVCIVEEFPKKQQMQKIAHEFNFSETAFVKRLEEDNFHIRWFSPKDEAPLCGHATLAAAHIIWEQKLSKNKTINFKFIDGFLKAHNKKTFITLDFPSKIVYPTPAPELLMRSLSYIPIESVYKDDLVYLVVVLNPKDLFNFQPSYTKIMHLPCRGVIVTALNNGYKKGGFDFLSRYFAPKVGIFEDSVCGSAHCRLAPFWGKRLQKKDLLAYQASSRGGVLRMSCKDNRVLISGQTVTTLEGNLLID
jgi:PhzF family phenazine biosynthesis protein